MKTLLRRAAACGLSLAAIVPFAFAQGVTGELPTLDKAFSDHRTLALTDLRDLLLEDAATPDFVHVEPGSPRPAEPLDDAAKIALRAREWQKMLLLWAEPPLDPERDKLQLLDNGTLVAQLTKEGHAWIARFLALQRGPRARLTTEFTLLEGAKGTLSAVVPRRPGNVLSAEEFSAAIAAAHAAVRPGSIDLLQAPSITLFVRSRADLSVFDSVDYVKDWRVRVVEPGKRAIAVPEIGTVEDGLGITARGVLLAPDRIGIEVELHRSTLTRPLRTEQVRLDIDGGRNFEIALPEVDKQRLTFQATLVSGSGVYFLGPGSRSDREVLVLARVAVLGSDAESTK
jgi:hypothetical protein